MRRKYVQLLVTQPATDNFIRENTKWWINKKAWANTWSCSLLLTSPTKAYLSFHTIKRSTMSVQVIQLQRYLGEHNGKWLLPKMSQCLILLQYNQDTKPHKRGLQWEKKENLLTKNYNTHCTGGLQNHQKWIDLSHCVSWVGKICI